MYTIDVSDAQKHFSKLLDQVSKGEQITITKGGASIAALQPVESEIKKSDIKAVIMELCKLSKNNKLQGLSLREMIEEGKK